MKTSRTKNGHHTSLCSYSPSSMPFDFYSGNSLKVLGYVRIDFCPEKKIRPSKSFIALLNELCFFSQYLQIITIRAFFGTETELVPSFIWFLIRWQKNTNYTELTLCNLQVNLGSLQTHPCIWKQGFHCEVFLTGKSLFSLQGFHVMKTGVPCFFKGKPCFHPVMTL